MWAQGHFVSAHEASMAAHRAVGKDFHVTRQKLPFPPCAHPAKFAAQGKNYRRLGAALY
jgi:hypothetical protein